jgi:hypothetical protein
MKHVKTILAAALAWGACACSPGGAPNGPPAEPGVKTLSAQETAALMKDPEPFRGQKVAVHGYLMYEQFNRNLFTSPTWDSDWNTGRCLPVSIADPDSQLAKDAADKEGAMVWLIGTIDTVVPEDEHSFDYCKKTGIVLERLR